MKMIKKIALIAPVIISLLFTPHHSHTMKRLPKENPQWVELVGNAILNESTATESFPFTDLPEDIQVTILNLLIINRTAKTLKEAAKTINALAQTNKYLNELINNPKFCLQTIKHLSKRFNCCNEIAAAALQTQEAKNRLTIQVLFKKIINKQTFSCLELKQLYEQYKDYVDLNFTYTTINFSNISDTQDSLLLLLATNLNFDKVLCLLSIDTSKKIDVNQPNMFGLTSFRIIALSGLLYNNSAIVGTILTFLCSYPNIEINQRDTHGNTILMDVSTSIKNKLPFNTLNQNSVTKTMTILLKNGADPEITNNEGKTPLKILEATYSNPDIDPNKKEFIQTLIDLMQNAIDKKHEKK